MIWRIAPYNAKNQNNPRQNLLFGNDYFMWEDEPAVILPDQDSSRKKWCRRDVLILSVTDYELGDWIGSGD